MPGIAGDAAADERFLAWVRIGASSALLVRLMTDTGPGHSDTVQVFTVAYMIWATLVLLASRSRSEWLLQRVNRIHATDFAWTTIASTVGGGTGSHAFIYFAFVLGAAAFRWDLRRTLITGAGVLVVGFIQSVAAAAGFTPWAFEFDEFLEHISYIACGMAVSFGVLADRLHRVRRQATTIATLVSGIPRAARLREAASTALVSMTNALQAGGIVMVAQDVLTGTTTVWRSVREGTTLTSSYTTFPHGHATRWLPPTGSAHFPCELRRAGAASNIRVHLSMSEREQDREAWLPLATGVVSDCEWRTLLAVPFSATGGWNGQLYVMDPGVPGVRVRLRFLADIVRQITPGLLNLYLLRRLRSRAESLERNRISRELHDTANQSIAAIDMRLLLLQKQFPENGPAASDLREIQALVRGLALDLREFVARRPEELDAARLRDALGDLVARISRESDIEAKLDWAVVNLDLPPHHCSELARIVQEALFNVRRHSGATRVVVRVEADAGGLSVIVEDNGRGLGFTGRLEGHDPEFERRTPRVIRERAVRLGGSVIIESSPEGTRLEIAFPTPELA